MEHKYYTADAHCDFLYFAATENFKIETLQKYQCMNLDRMKKGNVKLQFFAAWTDFREKRRSPLQQGLEMMAAYHRMLDENPNDLVSLTKDFEPSCGKTATVLAIEDLTCMEGNLANLEIFYHLGVRAATLIWNYKNDLACPAKGHFDGGLSPLGKATVKKMEKIGMATDFAHLSDRGIDDVLEITSSPVFSSHTNARGLYYHPRSLCDEHIKEIAKRGGVIGINFFHEQLCDRRLANSKDIADQIEYTAKVGGIDCVAIGSDFDGMSVYPEDVKHSGDLQTIAKELEMRGFSHEDIEKVMYSNLEKFIKQFV